MTRKTVIIIAATRARALGVARRLGVDPKAVLWPRGRGDLAAKGDLPLYVDMSLEGHPRHEEMADYVASRWRGTGGVGRNVGRLGNEPSLVLD